MNTMTGFLERERVPQTVLDRLGRARAERELEQFITLAPQLEAPSWDDFGDVLAEERVPQAVADNLRRARENRWAGLADAKAGYGPFRQMLDGAIALADQSAVTGTTEAGMWPTAQYTGWAGNQLRAGQVWYLNAFGIITTASSSQGNITLSPRFGTSSGGTSLGASSATALVASATNIPWQLEYLLVFRSVGLAGANSNTVGNGKFITTPAVIAASTGQAVVFGSTASVAVDLSVGSGLYMGVTMGSASDSLKTLGVFLESLN